MSTDKKDLLCIFSRKISLDTKCRARYAERVVELAV